MTRLLEKGQPPLRAANEARPSAVPKPGGKIAVRLTESGSKARPAASDAFCGRSVRVQLLIRQDLSMPVESADREAYSVAMNWLTAAVHELPASVLWGPNGATPAECREMLEGLEEFDRLCDRLGLDDHRELLDGCRWHFERYPHYLERRRHFESYERYIVDRKGPLRVGVPPRRW